MVRIHDRINQSSTGSSRVHQSPTRSNRSLGHRLLARLASLIIGHCNRLMRSRCTVPRQTQPGRMALRSGGGSAGGTGASATMEDDGLGSLWKTQPLPPLPVPYLPQDNDEDAGAGAATFQAGTGVLRLQTKALKALLALRRPAVFVSHVLYNPAVRRFLDSYLRHCTRPYEACLRAAAAPTTTTTTSPVPAANQGSEALRRTLSMLVLLLHLRLCTDAGAVDALGPKPDTLLRSTLDVPKALDLAALYGFTEPALLSRCLQAACRLRPSLAKPELSAALSASATVLADVGRVLAHAVEAEQQQREEQLLDDRLEYLADVTAALSRLAIAVPDQVAPAFTDGEGAGPKVLLALRGLYGRLVQLEGAGDGPLPAEGGALSVEALLVRGRRRRADARFARKCIVALVGAVVDGVVAVAAQAGRVGPGRAMAAEGLFTLVGGLLNAGSEEEGGPEEGRMMQDCIHQCPGGLRERVRKLLLLLSDGEDDEAAGSVQYLLQLLEAAAEVGREEAEARRQRRAGMAHGSSSSLAAREEERAPVQSWGGDVKRMIAEVKEVCPGLGDGFVHACLAVFRYNVAMVVNALLEGGGLPFPLDTLDRSLPSPMEARRASTAAVGTGGGHEERDEEFLAVQKAYVKQMEREEEEAAYLMDEYDDDYDDQWEEGDGEGIGFAMSKDSARERDFESIRRFNALLKKKEAEEAYWKDLAIQQEQLGEGEGEGEDEEGEVKQGAEPDGPGAAAPAQAAAGGFGARGGRGGGGGRGRGGGEGRGGSGGRGGADGGGDDMSARAKRRKEQQKSRIGNHNRKARANAKQSRGLGGPPVG